MKIFNDCFHTMLNTPVPPCEVKPQKAQLSYAQPHSINGVLLHKDAIPKEMRIAYTGSEIAINAETDNGCDLQQRARSAEWTDLDLALKGPARVAKLLIKKLQNERSKPGKPYRMNAKRLELTALFVELLDKAFAKQNASMTILTDGGGAGVILSLLEAY